MPYTSYELTTRRKGCRLRGSGSPAAAWNGCSKGAAPFSIGCKVLAHLLLLPSVSDAITDSDGPR